MNNKLIKIIIFLSLIFIYSSAYSNKVDYEDWSGLYFPKWMYDTNQIKYPNFKHFFEPNTNYILISNWKDKLILQSRLSSKKPLRFGYFDSEIKNPFNSKQIIDEDGCKIELNLKDPKLLVKMKSTDKCITPINISGEYIKYDHEKEKIKKGELFLGKFYNQDICDKATQLQWNNKDLEWSKDGDLIEFVDEAKRRKLNCDVKEGYTSVVFGCLHGMPNIPEYCEKLRDIKGPYPTLIRCIKRSEEIIKELPKYRPYMEPRGFRCEKM